MTAKVGLIITEIICWGLVGYIWYKGLKDCWQDGKDAWQDRLNGIRRISCGPPY